MSASPPGSGSGQDFVLQPPLSRFAIPSAAAGPIFAVIEIFLLSLAPYLGSRLYHAIAVPMYTPPEQLMLSVGILMAGLYLLLSNPRGGYELGELRATSLRGPVVRWCLTFMFFAVASFSFKIGDLFSRGAIMTGFLIGASAIVSLRLIAPFTVNMAFRHRMLEGRRTIILTEGATLPSSMPTEDLLQGGVSVEGWFRLPGGADRDAIGHLERVCDNVVQLARDRRVEDVVLVADAFRNPLFADTFERLRVLPLRILLLPTRPLLGAPLRPRHSTFDEAGLVVQSPPFTRRERLAKRMLDVAAASLLLVLLSPVLVAIGAMIRLDSLGPVLFRQTRIGYCGRRFMIYKFRSMYTTDDGPMIKQAEKGDTRITRVGRILREKSLDELPQLLNVVLGDMSLVGPRPHAVAHDKHYEPEIPGYAWRHHALPGITGWAQVKGHRGETPTLASMEARVEHDLWYIQNWSFWLDLKVLAMTVRAVLKPTNAH
jgi:Undecaprenyl-phosphate glucose phosphotransferase